MIYYIYDGSFDGLLTAIYEAYYRREGPDKILAQQDVQENFFIRYIHIPTDEEKAHKVYQSIKTKISGDALDNIFYVFLSDLVEAGTLIYHYLRLGWKIGGDVDKYLGDERVFGILQVRQKVLREGHRLLGLIRFSHVAGEIYYAPIEPDYQILGLVAPHFTRRLADQHWIIHDTRRGLAAMYNQKEWVLKEFVLENKLVFGEKEMEYQRLWREYFKSIAITNRINPRLQKRNMPMKYWKNLIEKNG